MTIHIHHKADDARKAEVERCFAPVASKGYKWQWQVVAYLPNHGQHFCTYCASKKSAIAYARSIDGPEFERVIVHQVYARG